MHTGAILFRILKAKKKSYRIEKFSVIARRFASGNSIKNYLFVFLSPIRVEIDYRRGEAVNKRYCNGNGLISTFKLIQNPHESLELVLG